MTKPDSADDGLPSFGRFFSLASGSRVDTANTHGTGCTLHPPSPAVLHAISTCAKRSFALKRMSRARFAVVWIWAGEAALSITCGVTLVFSRMLKAWLGNAAAAFDAVGPLPLRR